MDSEFSLITGYQQGESLDMRASMRQQTDGPSISLVNFTNQHPGFSTNPSLSHPHSQIQSLSTL